MADEVNFPLPPAPKTSWTIPLLLILSIFSLAISGYLFWQNQKLQQQLAAVQTPVAASPSPILAVSPTPDPTAGWKSYLSNTYIVKYPDDFNAEQNDGSILTVSKWGPTQKPQTEGYDGIFLTFTPKEIGSTLDAYVQTRIEEIKLQGVAELLSGPESIVINDYTGKTYTTQGFGINRYYIISSSDGVIFMEIRDNTIDPGKLGFSKTVNQILSTFKFTQ